MSPNSDISSITTTSTRSSCRPLHNQKYIDLYLIEKRKLTKPRLGIMSNLYIATVHESNNNIHTPLYYSQQDLCSVLNNNKNLNIKAYFHPNHTLCKEVNAELDINNVTIDESCSPRTILLQALQNSALSGGDKISSNGYCCHSKNIVMYI